jgi:hypothetical protein
MPDSNILDAEDVGNLHGRDEAEPQKETQNTPDSTCWKFTRKTVTIISSTG